MLISIDLQEKVYLSHKLKKKIKMAKYNTKRSVRKSMLQINTIESHHPRKLCNIFIWSCLLIIQQH